MSFRKKENETSTSIVFDIGSASVGAVLVLISNKKDQEPKIIYDTRIPILSKNSGDYRYFLLSMLSTLKNVVVNIEQDGLRKLPKDKSNIENISCIFSSSWHISNIETLHFEEEKSFTISAGFISDILKNVDKQFKQKNSDLKLIEKDIIQILLNGYSTDKPHGKKANNIDVTLFMSMISDEILQKTKYILEKTFNTDNILFHTFTLASFSIVRDIFNTEKNFLLMDISGEATNIILVRNEIMIKNMSFPFGKNFLMKRVADSMNTVEEEAHSLVRLFIEGKNNDKEAIKIESVLMNAKEEWLSSFRKILTDFSDGLSLPKTIFLTVDNDIGKWFIDTIKSDEFSMYTLAEQPFTVVELSSRILNEYCTVSQENQNRCDPFLAIEALFVHKIVND